MKDFQKQAEAHLAQVRTGLVVRTLPALVTPGDCFSPMAVCTTTSRATCTAVTIVFVVFGLLTSAA